METCTTARVGVAKPAHIHPAAGRHVLGVTLNRPIRRSLNFVELPNPSLLNQLHPVVMETALPSVVLAEA